MAFDDEVNPNNEWEKFWSELKKGEFQEEGGANVESVKFEDRIDILDSYEEKEYEDNNYLSESLNQSIQEMMKINYRFPRISDIDISRVVHKYIMILKMMHIFVDKVGITEKVIIDSKILKTAILDYYIDIEEFKNIRDISNVNVGKTYAYMSYWLIKRKPIQIVKEFEGAEFINELFVTSYLMSMCRGEKGKTGKEDVKNIDFKKFQSLLFYNMKYRTLSQQSLELMIEAFLM